MVRRLRDGKWAAFAALLLLAQPSFAQNSGVTADEEAALDNAAALVADDSPAPQAQRPQPEPRPAIWLLQDADTKIYLFGTFHILPQGFRWRSPAIEGVIRDADELVLEVSDRGTLEDPAAILRHMQLGKEVPLLWRVSRDRREALQEMIEETGLPVEIFDGMNTWSAVLMLAVMQIVRQYGGDTEAGLGADNLPGVEDVLEAEFAGSSRPVSGVETAAQQMSFFNALSFADQRRFLEEMVDAYRIGEAAADTSEVDWVQGNVEAMAIGSEEMPPVLYEALLTRRNRNWTDWLIARLDRPGTILFAVGAGHLAGPDSVQAMLSARGFAATRIN